MSRIGLVIGGGGLTGFAYTAATLTAIEKATGWKCADADVIVGTSAGAIVGGLVRGGQRIETALEELMTLPANETGSARVNQLTGGEQSVWDLNLRPSSISLAKAEVLRGTSLRPGRVLTGLVPPGSVPTDAIGDRMTEFHDTVWPDEDLYIAAVRIGDGERVVFGRDRKDIAVGTAVEASSAIPGFFKPVEIDGERFVDGAMNTPTNADVIAEESFDLTVVIAPMSVDSYVTGWMLPTGALRLYWRAQVAREMEQLREAGHRVMLLEPSIGEARAMGPTLMDSTRIPNVVQKSTTAINATLASGLIDSDLEILRSAA